MSEDTRIALVTGANRGIGFAVARSLAQKGIQTLVTARNEKAGMGVAQRLADEGLPVDFLRLDVTSVDSISSAVRQIRRGVGRLDILVNNAGVMPDKDQPLLDLSSEMLGETLQTNVLGALSMIQAVVPIMREHGYGRIVNISSSLGLLAEMGNPRSPFAAIQSPAYRISKCALNAVTALIHAELAGSNILVNSLCPGWVKTDLGGPQAPRTAEQAAADVVWLATLPAGGPSGGFYSQRQLVAW